MKIHELQRLWDVWYNSPLIADPALDYIAVSTLRLLVAYGAWRMLQALWRYANVAVPPPHTLDNLGYWLRWWVWLRLRDRPVLKASATAIALAAVLQIFGGADGQLNDCSPYFVLMCSALIGLFISLAREFHARSFIIQHPAE